MATVRGFNSTTSTFTPVDSRFVPRQDEQTPIEYRDSDLTSESPRSTDDSPEPHTQTHPIPNNAIPALAPEAPTACRRARWSRDETDVYMAHLADLTKRGMFGTHRATTWIPAWRSLLERMENYTPNKPWSTQLMKTKRKLERARYLQYQVLVNEYTSSDGARDENGLPVISEQQWADFLRRCPNGKWLRSAPLINKEIYAQAFPSDQQQAAGDIPDAEDAIDSPSSPTAPVTPVTHTHTHPRKRAFDPGAVASDSTSDIPYPSKMRSSAMGLVRQAMPMYLAQAQTAEGETERGLPDAILGAAHELGRVPGTSDIEKAFINFQRDYANDMSDEDFGLACEALLQPLQAVAFNVIHSKNDRLRYLKCFMEKYKR